MVITDARGNVRDEFCTLVQPEGVTADEARAKRVHLIDANWLKAAPPTSAVLVELAHRLNGRVVVAHNAMFDTEFLQQEFKRCLDYTDDDLGDWTTLCTVDLCRAVDIPRKLDRACFQLGIRYEKHSALGDCHATAQLLHNFMNKIDPRTFAAQEVTRFRRMPEWKPAPRVDRGQAATLTNARPVLEGLISALPPHDGTSDRDPAAADAYLVALQDAIANGYVSPQEVDSLMSSATRLGSRPTSSATFTRSCSSGSSTQRSKTGRSPRWSARRLRTSPHGWASTYRIGMPWLRRREHASGPT